MRVIVLGAGVVGVSTAYALSQRGAEVVVIDRQGAPAQETSFANGGQISACHVTPWANPHTPHQLMKWLGRAEAPLFMPLSRLSYKFDPDLFRWGLLFLSNIPGPKSRLNMERSLRVALHSREILRQWRKDLKLDYDQKSKGILSFYRDPAEFESACAANTAMNAYGLDRTIKTVEECVTIEPALHHVQDQMVGGIYSPSDESGDAHIFAERLAEAAISSGVEFRLGDTISELLAEDKTITGVRLKSGEDVQADAVVVSLGSFSGKLTRTVGFDLPIYPAKGYSITVDTTGRDDAPSVSLIDDEHKMVFSRLGERLRAAGTAEMNGWDDNINQRRAQVILDKTRALFPNASDYNEPNFWAGLRPCTPDSVPLIGKTPVKGLWLNTGHGTLGWTMAAGSGDIIADAVMCKTPAVDMDGLGMDRFG